MLMSLLFCIQAVGGSFHSMIDQQNDWDIEIVDNEAAEEDVEESGAEYELFTGNLPVQAVTSVDKELYMIKDQRGDQQIVFIQTPPPEFS